MTAILVVGLVLSSLVLITDTWFHFATKAINLAQVHPNLGGSDYGLGLVPACYDVKTPYAGGCTLNPAGTATFLMRGQETMSVLGNLSDTRVKINAVDNDVFAYVGNSPSVALDSTDYTAHSWAVQTQCMPVTTKCVKSDNIFGAGFRYKCPFAMEGLMTTTYQNTMAMAYFTDQSGKDNVTQFDALQNPYYFAAIVAVNQNIGHGTRLTGQTEILSTGHGADLFAVFCNATVYDLEYTSVNGTLTRFEKTPSNSSVTNIVQGAQQYSRVGEPNIIQGASIAALISSTAQEWRITLP